MFENIIIISGFLFLFLVMIIRVMDLKQKGINFWGQPPIKKPLYILGKTSLFVCWFILIFKGIGISHFTIELFSYSALIGTLFFLIGVFFITIPFFTLKNALKMGIEKQNDKLITGGIYSISRNPMYLGFYLTCIGSLLCFSTTLNLICAITTIIIHHKIVITEENILKKSFAQKWISYTKKVRRYL